MPGKFSLIQRGDKKKGRALYQSGGDFFPCKNQSLSHGPGQAVPPDTIVFVPIQVTVCSGCQGDRKKKQMLEYEVQQVWEKGQVVTGNNPSEWRKDCCGAWISRVQYGNRNSQYGWEVDHIIPGDDDRLSNLRPLQWKNNASRQDGPLVCVVKSDGINNIG